MQLIRLRLLLLVLLTSIGIGMQAPAAFAVVDAAAPPDAVDDEATVRSAQETFLDVMSNDIDPDFDFLSITAPASGIPTATAHGTVTCDSFSGCYYRSANGWVGADSFTYTISDGNGGVDTATVSITVLANTPPTAVDDELEAATGHTAFVFVAANDIETDEADYLTLSVPTPDEEADTPHGKVTCGSSGTCEYISDPGWLGPDGFDYTIVDSSGASDVGHVTITVVPNQAPEAEDDTYARGDDITLRVLANDSDPEQAQLEISAVTQPAHGTATITLEQDAIAYTQTSNFTASDSFTYTVSDGHGGTDTATVTLQACPALAPAIDVGGIVTSERWVACSALQANGAAGPTTSVFPPQGGTSALLTSGDVALAPGPNDSSGAGSDNGTDLRGAFDVSILRLDLSVPAGANCLSFDLAFQSEEFPEFVGSFNDGFLAELDASSWQLEGNEITAPLNFAFDPAGELVSVNSAFFTPERVITETGSQYDGSTPLLNVRTPITPGPHVLYLSIFDAGDHILDSAAFVDRLVAGAAGPGGCAAGANEPPNAVEDGFEFMEDVQATLDVRVNDSDPDGHPITITSASPTAQHGTVSCTATDCTYTPDLNYFGPDSFTYAISDGHGGTDTATVSITVLPQNDPPVAVDDSLTTPQNTPGSVNVFANDSDIDNPLAISGFSHGAHGTVDCVGGVCTYTPAPGYTGPDSFDYFLSDGAGGSDQAVVSVTVTAPPANQPPVADDEELTVAEDSSGNVVSVLPGDVDPDGDPLTVGPANPAASHGSVSCTTAGVCTYTPNANYHGPDSFIYNVSDGKGGQDTGQVSITVTPVNDDPNAVNNVLTTPANTAGLVNVLANDTDVDGDTLTVTTLTPTAAHGTVSCTAAGLCTYTPNANYSGPDSFTYVISDAHGGTDTATVSVTVTPPTANTPPVADDETLTLAEDASGNVNVLAGDTDPDSDPLTVTSLAPSAAHGTVACTSDGVCTYTPNANYNGPDSFTYTVSDGKGGTDTGEVSITVTPVNDNPIAVNDTLTIAEDTPGSLLVIANDSDPDGGTVQLVQVTDSIGTASCHTDTGICTYTPAPNFHGLITFGYGIVDGQGSPIVQATVTVTVTPVNDNPNAVDDSLTTTAGTAKDVNVLANDTDIDGGPRTVTTAAPTAAHGTVSCTVAGVCTYTPNPGYVGPDSFEYSISDGNGGTDTATVNVTVNAAPPVNQPPNAVDDSYTTPKDKPLSVNVFGNDSDDGAFQLFTYTQPAHGSAHCTIAGDCTYTPAAGYVGPDSFTYTIADGQAEDTATVSITVTGSNTAPSCANVKPSKTKLWPPRHKFILITLSGATDADGDPLTWKITKVTQDEKTKKAISQSDKGPDAQRVAGKPNQVKLKAERVASGNGRVYRIFYTVTDGQGGKCTGVEKVGVPRTKTGTAIDNTAKRYNSFN